MPPDIPLNDAVVVDDLESTLGLDFGKYYSFAFENST